MAGRIQGITVEIGDDTTKLQTALKGVNTEIRNTQSQLRDVDKLLKLDPENTELLQDIIERADIGRTTFYAHFETKDSVLDAICTDLFSHIFDEHPKEEEDHDFSKALNTLQDKLTHILYHLKEDQKHYGRLFSGESAELFWDYFRRWFEKELGEEIRDILKTKKITVPENLFMDLYIGTFIETVKWWFRDGCKETPEQVEGYFEEVF